MSKPPAKVVLYDVHPGDQPFFHEALSDFQLEITEKGLTEATAALARDAQVIATHVTSDVTAGLMARMPQLQHVACRSTGFDHVDLGYTSAHDITVSTVPAYGEDTVAEYTFMLLLAVARRLMPAVQAVKQSHVDPQALTGHDLTGKTLGVIGTGRIGRHTARIGRGFGMEVVAYDLYPNQEAAHEIGFEYLPLEELFSRADYISLHAPATLETHHLINAHALRCMKPGVFIVNTARGSLVDLEALTAGLKSGQVAGAGLDVLEGEEHIVDHSDKHIQALSQLPNVIITNHNAYNSAEALARIRETTVANIQAWHSGNPTNLAPASAHVPLPK